MSELISQPNTELEEFLEFIYGDQTGYSYIALRPPSTDQWNTFYFEWPKGRDKIINFIKLHSSTNEVYYSPALFSKPSGKREDFKTSRVVWCEFDGELPSDSHSKEIPDPSLRVRSSTPGHEHWYWRLSNAISDSKALETITARLAFKLSADHCWNSNRVLRPITTTHHESRQQVQIISQNFQEVTPTAFATLPELPNTLSRFSIGSIPKVLDVVAKYPWEPEPWAFFMEEKIKDGRRSSALTKLALICIEMGMKNAEVLSVLYSADDRWKKFKDRSDRKERLISLVKYARTKALKNSTLKKSSALATFSFKEFFEQDIKVEWVIKEVLPKGGSAIISGPPEVGKTQISLQMAIHLALGKQFLNWKPERPWKSCFLSLEMGHADLLIFMDNMRKDLSTDDFDLLHENLTIIPLGEPLKLDKPEGQEKLNEVLSLYKPEGLFVDSFGQAMTGLNDEEAVNTLYDYLHRVVKNKHGCFNWLVHFPRKGQVGNRKPKTLDDLYGNRYIGGQIDLGLCAWPVGDAIELSFIKKRLGKKGYPLMIRRTDNLNFKLSGIGNSESDSATAKTKAEKTTNIMDF